MLAIDTNIIVRYLTGDHPVQSLEARRLVEGHDLFVTDTVLLEIEWVLRSVYACAPADLCRALRGFAGLPRVSIESPILVAQALDRVEGGMDFAKALHLGRADRCEAFVTFDRRFIKSAIAAGLHQVRTPSRLPA